MQKFAVIVFMKRAGILIFPALLFLIAWKDYRTRKIPDRYIAALLMAGILFYQPYPPVTWQERGAGGVLVSGLLLLLSAARPLSFGGGDIKLMAAAGVVMGGSRSVWAFVTGVLAAGLYAGVHVFLGRKKLKDSFALGPFLCAGIIAAVFLGDHLTQWFLSG